MDTFTRAERRDDAERDAAVEGAWGAHDALRSRRSLGSATQAVRLCAHATRRPRRQSCGPRARRTPLGIARLHRDGRVLRRPPQAARAPARHRASSRSHRRSGEGHRERPRHAAGIGFEIRWAVLRTTIPRFRRRWPGRGGVRSGATQIRTRPRPTRGSGGVFLLLARVARVLDDGRRTPRRQAVAHFVAPRTRQCACRPVTRTAQATRNGAALL